ncbi:hypothetical protein RJ41_14305 [Alteromonas marina]|uniref:Glycosyltransferase 2-like domain-containing protein n=1 Tax=Alteromonas marina TaxID=203795 RepID=A0A0B3Y832_9ALTE|nr:glycosyltransferase family 2 protein [Alteromonas marina]KHT48275.1 hypothetical protein RJ41_14305 [Alteromonas marina]
MSKIDISVLVTCHKERQYILPAIESARLAIEKLKGEFSVTHEIIIYLDNSDSQTLAFANEVSESLGIEVYRGKNGDPGLSRMAAINCSNGEYIAFLDGDDLWSENWLVNAWKMVESSENELREKTIFHPEYNLIFGNADLFVRQGDPSSDYFDLRYLRFANYWDALCLAHRTIFNFCPIPGNNLALGFAHEDYNWNCKLIEKNFRHVLVKDTIHFKRRRTASVSVNAEKDKNKVTPSLMQKYKMQGDLNDRS